MNGNTIKLAKFLLIFFARKAFSHESLRSKYIKLLVCFGVVTAYFGYWVFVKTVLNTMVKDPRDALLLIGAISQGLSLWTFIFFMIVRVLFMKADKLVELTYTFPITNKQRIFAFTLFELATVFAGVCVISAPLTVWCGIIAGGQSLAPIIFGIIPQIIVLYLVVELMYLTIVRLLGVIGLSRWSSLFTLCFLVGIFVANYFYLNSDALKFAEAIYERRTHYNIFNVFLWFNDNIGTVATTFILVFSIAFMVWSISLVTPKERPRIKYFFRVPVGVKINVLGMHFRAVIRSRDFILSLVLAVGFSIIVLSLADATPPLGLAIISMQGVYAFTTCQPVCKLYRLDVTALKTYLYMAIPYLSVLLVMWMPVSVLSWLRGVSIWDLTWSLGVSLFILVLCLTVSIYFPAEKHNPYSVLIGMCVALALIALLAFTVMIWELPVILATILWCVVAVVCAVYSVFGISSTQKREYHANV